MMVTPALLQFYRVPYRNYRHGDLRGGSRDLNAVDSQRPLPSCIAVTAKEFAKPSKLIVWLLNEPLFWVALP
jgi:hypothetical protein